MSYSRMIHEFIDEGLPKSEEEILFSELAKDAELRDDFNKQMKIHLIAQNDMNSIFPPADCTSNIFSTLGFSIPNEEKPVAPIISFSSKFFSGIKKYAAYLMIATLSSIITGAMFLAYDNYFNADNHNSLSLNNSDKSINSTPYVSSKNNDNSSNIINNKALNSNISNSTNSLPRKFSNQLTNNDSYSNSSSKDAASNLNNNLNSIQDENDNLITNNNQSDNSNLLLLVDNSIFSSSDISKSNNASQKFAGSRAQSFEKINSGSFGAIVPINIFQSESANYYDDSKYILSFKRINTKSEPNIGELDSKESFFDNFVLTAIYRLDNYNAIGLQYGRERFGQEFDILVNGKTHIQSQNPVINYGALTYRLSVNPEILESIFTPYFQTSAGLSTIGPIANMSVGSSIRLMDGLSVFGEFDAAALWYNVNDKIYNTLKYGVNYGISVSIK